VGLIPYDVSPWYLLSLATGVLSTGGEVVLFSDSTLLLELLVWMPAPVEVLPLAALVEDPGWPDYLALDLEVSAFGRFVDEVPFQWVQCEGEVLVRTSMPCHGVGDCGVCAVHTRGGWRLACMDGPVFPIAEVFDVA